MPEVAQCGPELSAIDRTDGRRVTGVRSLARPADDQSPQIRLACGGCTCADTVLRRGWCVMVVEFRSSRASIRTRPRRLLSSLAVTVLSCTVAAGCEWSSSGNGDLQSSPTAVPGRTRGPLADGLEIEDGSALIGTVFPHPYDTGWSARLRIDGDPREVFDSYREQTEAVVNLSMRPDSATGCFQDDPDGFPHDPRPHANFPGFPLACFSGGVSGHFAVYLTALVNPEEDRAYLTIDFEHLHPINPPLLPLAPDGPAAPPTDEEIHESGPAEEPLRVIEGSRLVDEPLPTAGGIGYEAVLEVTGDPLTVMRGYAVEFGREHEGDLRGDDRVLVARYESAGGGYPAAVAVIGDPTFIRVTYGYD